MEIWKDIKDYEGLYQVSDLGRIKSLNYRQMNKEGILKPGKDKDGYLQVNLSKKGEIKVFKVHRLVINAFIEKPYNKDKVNHKNRYKK